MGERSSLRHKSLGQWRREGGRKQTNIIQMDGAHNDFINGWIVFYPGVNKSSLLLVKEQL
jgi:hypothetical protein